MYVFKYISIAYSRRSRYSSRNWFPFAAVWTVATGSTRLAILCYAETLMGQLSFFCHFIYFILSLCNHPTSICNRFACDASFPKFVSLQHHVTGHFIIRVLVKLSLLDNMLYERIFLYFCSDVTSAFLVNANCNNHFGCLD